MELDVFTDGGARGNPGPAAVGVVVKRSKIKDQKSKILEEETMAKFGKRIGVATNNVAEYRAVIEALTWIKENFSVFSLPSSVFSFYLDSRLVVNQLNGVFKVKDSRLRELLFKIRQLEAEMGVKIFYNFIPREKNFLADGEVNRALNQNL